MNGNYKNKTGTLFEAADAWLTPGAASNKVKVFFVDSAAKKNNK
jgi:hypothetical protein